MSVRDVVRRFGPLVVAFCVCWTGVGQTVCDFVSPESTIQIAELSFAYRHFDDGGVEGVESSGGWFNGRFERLYDSPSLGYTMRTNTQIALDTWVAASWLLTGSVSYRYYFAEELPLFAYAGVRVDAATYYRQPGCELRSGIGIGRFRDVTPMAQAIRIVKAVMATAGRDEALSSSALSRIAEEIAKEASYESFDEYVEGVATVVERAVGELLGSPAAVLAVRAELESDSAERYCGAILQAGVGYEVVDPNREAEDILYVFTGDVGQALSPDSQVRCRLSWSGASADFFGENTTTLEATYDAERSGAPGVRASYVIRRDVTALSDAVTSQVATVEYTLGIGRSDAAFALTLSKETGDPKWTVDLSLSLSLDLL